MKAVPQLRNSYRELYGNEKPVEGPHHTTFKTLEHVHEVCVWCGLLLRLSPGLEFRYGIQGDSGGRYQYLGSYFRTLTCQVSSGNSEKVLEE